MQRFDKEATIKKSFLVQNKNKNNGNSSNKRGKSKNFKRNVNDKKFSDKERADFDYE
jgi:hypothetical protein